MKVIDNKIYLEVAELVSYGIPKETIYNGVSSNSRGKTSSWEHLKELGQRSILILYDKIGVTSLKKLPAKTELLEQFLSNKAKEAELLEAVTKIQTA